MRFLIPAGLGLALVIAAAAPAGAAEAGGTLKKIGDSGTIVLGHRESSPPFSFIDAEKRPAGFTVDLCLRVVEAVKQKLARPDLAVRYVALSADDRVARVGDGSVDIECGNSTQTISRRQQVDFSLPTFITGASLLLPAGSTVQSLGDLTGKRVSVVTGTTTETALRERLQQGLIDARVMPVKDHAEGLRMLQAGEVEAHAGDQVVLIGLARGAEDPSRFALAPELFSYEPYGLMVRRNDADFRLVVDGALAQLYRTGQIAQIYEKWFGDWGGRPSPLLLAMYALNGLPE